MEDFDSPGLSLCLGSKGKVLPEFVVPRGILPTWRSILLEKNC